MKVRIIRPTKAITITTGKMRMAALRRKVLARCTCRRAVVSCRRIGGFVAQPTLSVGDEFSHAKSLSHKGYLKCVARDADTHPLRDEFHHLRDAFVRRPAFLSDRHRNSSRSLLFASPHQLNQPR